MLFRISDSTLKRITKELQNFNRKNDTEIKSITPINSNMLHLRIELTPQSVVSRTEFKVGEPMILECKIKDGYPMVAPTFTFVEGFPKDHPNIATDGKICLGDFTWSPVSTIETVCRYILVLLAKPNPADALNIKKSSKAEENKIDSKVPPPPSRRKSM